MQCILRFGSRTLCGTNVRPVGLVDYHDVSHLHHAAFHTLQLVARSSQHDQQEEVHHVVNCNLRLADSDSLNEDGFVSSRLTEQHRFAGTLRNATKRSASWSGADKGHVARSKSVHAGLVAQDASARKLAAGIDGEHGDLLPMLSNQVGAEHLDHTALACTGNARDADSN